MSRVAKDSVASKLSRVNRFFAKDVEAFKKCLTQLASEIDPQAVPQPNDAHHVRLLRAFQESQDACCRFEAENADDPTMILDAQDGFRTETDPWFSQSWIAHRARTKPSGFAGDFEMLIKIYDESTPARGLGGYLDLCLLDLPLAQAVRARLIAAREFLIREIASRDSDVRILDIACGPCREYRDWPDRGNGSKVEIVAMDNDPLALAYVSDNVANRLTEATSLRAVRYNALRTKSAAATIRNFGKFDVIYSVGLCDYLSDAHLIGMLSAWRETLHDGGVLYVAFKDTERYDQTPYQWHLDWFFVQRTQKDVFNLFNAAGFNIHEMETTLDRTGIIVNFVHRTPRQPLKRMDIAERVSQRHGGSVSSISTARAHFE